jgi:hypothetical protein
MCPWRSAEPRRRRWHCCIRKARRGGVPDFCPVTMARGSFVEIFVRHRAIETANTRSRQYLRSHETRIHTQAVSRLVDSSPVGDASALSATMKFDPPVTPHVNIGRRVLRREMHLLRRIISPQHAIPSANRTIAIRDLFWRRINHDVNCAAMTRRLDRRLAHSHLSSRVGKLASTLLVMR